jgi:adenosylmethionine---8-amino-7-oxononanoate aminotransferase
VYEAFLTSDKTKTFFHGHSYTANPTACAAALASLDLFQQESTMAGVERINTFFRAQCNRFSAHPAVKDARCLGAIFALEIKTPEATEYLNPLAERVQEFFLPRGIILRPLGNILYVLPPYCITEEQLEKIMGAVDEFLGTI